MLVVLFYIIVQLHFDSSFGGFALSTLLGTPTLRIADSSRFSSFSVFIGGTLVVFVSSRFCLVFWDFAVRLFVFLMEGGISFLSPLDFPRIVTLGREPSRGSSFFFSFSIAIVAALYAKSWTMELQKRIASVASSRVRLLFLLPPWLSSNTVDSSVEKHNELIKSIMKKKCSKFLQINQAQ